MAKVTWHDIYMDFRRRHPSLSKNICYWVPYDYAQVLIRFKNGDEMVHDYDEHIAKFIKHGKEN